ncbi:hypothetical protein [Hymenobacter siberiensis]|jgi:hypothetical protein|uniref:hypothetical protein n=1 Tax=Hymenobacter siberiensis TaxID=2848396 RepID=UPI001C1E11F2|nr:hypothetical protein [Hymenobacter siberiensis]MBU6123315.1 hypothetical protein [Hymenobacter siberiensis]
MQEHQCCGFEGEINGSTEKPSIAVQGKVTAVGGSWMRLIAPTVAGSACLAVFNGLSGEMGSGLKFKI